MAALTEAAIIAKVSTVLNDTGTAIWGTADIRAELDLSLRELAKYSPQHMTKGTATFGSTAKELSISALTDLLEVEDVEYVVDLDPKRYRNFAERGSTVIPDISFTPTSGATAFIWYSAPHTVSDASTINTLNIEEERIIIELTAAHLAMNTGIDKINQINLAGARTWTDFQTWGERKEDRAINDMKAIAKPKITQDWPKVY